MNRQLNLFEHVAAAYANAENGILDNDSLYETVAREAGLDASVLEEQVPIGERGDLHNPTKRAIRWFQQSLKKLKVIERVEGERGIWKLTEPVGKELHRAADGVKLVAFSTDLGVAIWSRHEDVFPKLDEPVHLYFSSPMFPLRRARAYGNPDLDFIDHMCGRVIEPLLHSLAPGGHIVLNLSNDIFEPGSPERSLYVARLMIALKDRLGLAYMGTIPWINKSKPPGPTYWACVNRVHLASAWEHMIWFTNDASKVTADNRRVLEPHTDRQLKLMHAGGANRTAQYGDGAYKIRPDSFGRVTEGRIPKNIIERGHYCKDTVEYRARAKELGLPLHGAMMPTYIPERFIQYLTKPGELVADFMSGTARTGLAAERLGRRWIVTEWILQYLRGAAGFFTGFPGYSMNPAMFDVGCAPDKARLAVPA
jgi:site-specific DNA-methyltransferase (cytosine-N4-specific)